MTLFSFIQRTKKTVLYNLWIPTSAVVYTAKVHRLFQAEPFFRDRVSYRLRLTPS